MFAKPLTIKATTELWVSQFNAINQDIIARLMKYEPDTWREVTIPVVGDAVYHSTAKATGEIIEYDEQSGDYLIRLVYSEKKIYARTEELESSSVKASTIIGSKNWVVLRLCRNAAFVSTNMTASATTSALTARAYVAPIIRSETRENQCKNKKSLSCPAYAVVGHFLRNDSAV